MLQSAQLRTIVRECASKIERHNGQIRALQDEMLEDVPIEQWPTAIAALDAILGKNRIIHMAETTNNFDNVGVANTGRMSGTITGNSQHIEMNESAKQLLAAFEQFRKQIQELPSLSTEQREDAVTATSDLEAEVAKPEESRSLSKVRNAVSALKTLAAGTEAVRQVYEQLHPFIAAHFHLLG